jgi:hypothetical protein
MMVGLGYAETLLKSTAEEAEDDPVCNPPPVWVVSQALRVKDAAKTPDKKRVFVKETRAFIKKS